MRYVTPTLRTDYSIDPRVFNVRHWEYDHNKSPEANRYRLAKAIVAAYRKKKYSVKESKQFAARNCRELCEQAANRFEIGYAKELGASTKLTATDNITY